ncbi:hypothetical protein SASPL_150666 [Salvia splendens]|uniref:Transcription factor CBF/NF-Y/archaeal histone domain-containing protein n=1 Tax=Salvia splendens TaxID=180675 RepID=A0A8X8Z315_SALSN|nr:hypothetical protein SASPL_150666 [Salvia splendens]
MSDGSHDNGDLSPKSSVREQDRFLPIANIGRIMKKGLPPNGKIAKDAKDTVQECVSEFISFVTSDVFLPLDLIRGPFQAGETFQTALLFSIVSKMAIDYLSGAYVIFWYFCLLPSGLSVSFLTLPSNPVELGLRASDKCQKEKRKTVNGDDLLWAMATLGFEDYITPLKVYLARYRELEGDTKGSARGADGAPKRDTIGTQLGSDAQFTHQDSFSQGFGYSNSHIEY